MTGTCVLLEQRDRAPDREDKDALDVLRILRATETVDLAARLGLLGANDIAQDVTREAIDLLPRLFGAPDAEGVAMVVRAAGTAEPSETLTASLLALVEDLLEKLAE